METPCILHTGCVQNTGYGQVRREGKLWLAHRWAAHNALGPCPVGQVCRHKCDVRLCINPEHLEYGTQGQNLCDRKHRGIYRKLNKENVAAIRLLIGTQSLASIGRLFGVTPQMISHIKDGRQWADT